MYLGAIVAMFSLALLSGCPGTGGVRPVPPAKNEGMYCPVGSDVDSSGSAVEECGGKAGVEVKTQSGEVAGKCFSSGNRIYQCKLHNNLCEKYGLLRMTREEIQCNPAPGTPAPALVSQREGQASPGEQVSSTCRFDEGPRAGQVQSYKGLVQPIRVGSPCTDGRESFGTAIPDSGSEQLSSTCRFNEGPRAGQVQSYKGLVQPIPVGSPCTDGRESFGTAIPDSGSEQLSNTCRFNEGPRAGQVQSYKGIAAPIPVGSPCTDGQQSFGTAIPD